MSTGISYVDETWNPAVGCEPVSEGCAHCYAAAFASRELCATHAGLAVGGRWNGRVRLVPDALERPLRWAKPRRVLTPSMGDLFHDDVPDDYLAAWFGVMAAAPAHTFLVLTKRARRLSAWLDWVDDWALVKGDRVDDLLADCATEAAGDRVGTAVATGFLRWPPRNVLLGATVENQRRADERLPEVAHWSARGWRTWLSVEPLLERVDLLGALASAGDAQARDRAWRALQRLRFVTVGGEAGLGARPCKLAWIGDVAMQCRNARIPLHVKQMGSNSDAGTTGRGGDMSEWPLFLMSRAML